MATAQDIIKDAMGLIGAIGIGETPTDAELQEGLTKLNNMLGTLSNNRAVIYARTEESFTLTQGERAYEIGTNTTRPISIESAYIRDSDSRDTPLKIITEDKYNGIPDKSMEGLPYCLLYDSQHPSGHIYLYFVPDSAYTLVLDSWKPFTAFASLTTIVAFPPGYEEMFTYNLTKRLAPRYGLTVTPEVREIARDTLRALRSVNSETLLSDLGVPKDRSTYIINTDSIL